ncbi:calcium channel-like protein subunit Cch1 [Lentithecium fluviatile CBS 122367]|uniref:Calcium-channel protein CCH1 n=1 Tax=Lentithecium fluviatile CBS 122367 TaxID=1168545 RepID=A0A6G1JL80_9PLEO|nr:calcium channel-like protein subunit Cch1 [Lentithecium fluviatile CBS 122367]
MSSPDSNYHRNQSHQSIPLRDLNRPPDDHHGYTEGGAQQHRRTLSDRGRNLLRHSGALATGHHWNSQYAPIAEASPSPTRTGPRPHVDTSTAARRGHAHEEEDDDSPVDIGAFQAAIGFSGLSFQGETSPPIPTPMSSEQSYHQYGDPYTNRSPSPDTGFFSPVAYEDTVRLTDSRNLQPLSGSPAGVPTFAQHMQDRSSFQSVRFLTPENTAPAAAPPHTPMQRLGDDIGHVEAATAGLRTSTGRKRSLSPGGIDSPLHRAGTIMRNMSQRVVNISNEPEVAERTMRRKSALHARLQEPPSFPALPEYLHDGASTPTSPVEKPPSPLHPRRPSAPWQAPPNPLKGKTLGFIPPDSKLRMNLCDVLVHPFTEPLLLVLIVVQTVLLAIDARESVFETPRTSEWGSAVDYSLLGLFIVYTVEAFIRIIVSGFIINPIEYSTINRQVGVRQAVLGNARRLFGPQRQPSLRRADTNVDPHMPSVLRTFTTAQINPAIGPGDSRDQQRARLAHRAYLRHSFNRTDFVAVVSFWISFGIGISGIENKRHIYIFKMLSCLRIIRLLNLTSGTSVILRSLKKAAPLLVNVAFLISFFWLLFAVVGVQSFKSSFRRNCVWIDPQGIKNFTNTDQHCGGHLKNIPNAEIAEAYINAPDMPPGTDKGFLCPKGSLCIELENPYNGTQSFDNILQSLELVFVIMSSNTYSDLLYMVADSDYLIGALFFAAGILILSLWLISLLIAVITSSFQIIREESKASAFTGEQIEEEEKENLPEQRVSTLKRLYDKTFTLWILIISYGLICQALRSASMSESRTRFIDLSETGVTFLLLAEIVIRFATDWRHFFYSKRNITDLFIAVVTTVIQIPAVKDSHNGRAYAWLTIFQIIRIYRVVLAVPMTRDLVMIVLGNVGGLLNLILFVFLLTFLASIFASQLFRGELPYEKDGNVLPVSFFTIYNSFIGMYQILSSEDWTSILYHATSNQVVFHSSWIGASFCILWFIFANFIVLNMFIAVIQENFDVSEDEKRLQQVKAFLQKKEQGTSSSYGNLSLSSIFKLGQATRQDPLDYGSAAAEMLLKDAVVRDFLDETDDVATPQEVDPHPGLRPAPTIVGSGAFSSLWQRFLRSVSNDEPNPFYAPLDFGRAYEDIDPRRMAKEVVTATEKRKKAQREYLRKHPNYNVSLFIFGPRNPVRRLCQRIVGPGRGKDRMEGLAPSVPVWYAFSAFIYAAIIAMVLLACVTTPLYQREYFRTHPFSVRNWFVWTDMGFAVLFSIEALIKVIADGFFFTPNAYFRGSWGFIDGVVLVTLWVNVATSLYNEGQITRTVGAFKALRALRLLNISDSARDHFHSLIVRGWWKLFSAAFVSLSLLIPFAIYGLNLFVGQLQSCNDDGSGIFNLHDCVNEYPSQLYDWQVLAPRQASNPFYDFDNFGNSLFILFQIVSQEGWTDVMWTAESITGVFTQPTPFASQGNAVYFIIFNLLGAVFVLTLFVSVFMRNYTEQTGVAFLTTDQRSWLELRKLLRQVSPSKRPSSTKQRETWEEWCYRRAVRKTGRWQRFITALLILHLILLCLEWYPGNDRWDRARDYIFLVFTIVFISNVVIRIIGLSWHRFRKSSWDVFSIFAVSGTFVTSILRLTNFKERVFAQLHKLCLVSIALLLIPRNNQLDQLFKTAAASLASIMNLLATWFVLFLVYAIALTQTFGLTRFGPGETGNINFRSVPKALILLFRCSTGEGWNELMEDFAMVDKPFCTEGEKYFESDCGSPEWARALFITWNILSMYIFVNLFVSLIYESFSYVYQRSSGLSVISREEIRRFKQAWAEFDPNGTGYVSKEVFPRLLGELSGIFEMRIYDGDFTVGRLVEECSTTARRMSELPIPGREQTQEIDLARLNQRLAELPVAEIRRRRQRMNQFYEEVLVSSDPDRGIQFTSLLMILAHYKVINDNKSLRLEEFLRRRARLQRVDEAVRRNVVIGFFDTLYWARRFRRAMEQKKSGRMTAVPQFTVPEIFVDDEDITDAQRGPYSASGSPMFSPVDLQPVDGVEWRASGSDAREPSPPADMTLRSRANSIQHTPLGSPTRATPLPPTRASPQMSPFSPPADGEWQFASALSRPPSPLEPEPGPSGNRSRQNSSVNAADVLEVLDNSAWGESIRRSFTQRRSSGR